VIVLLVLGSAFLHALWNALLKNEADKEVAGVAVLGFAALASAAVALTVAVTTGRRPFGDPTALFSSVAAGLFEAGYFITLVLSLERAPLGLAYTVSRGTAIVLVWPISALWLGEEVTALAIGGSLTLLAGLVVSGLDGGKPGRGAGMACLCGAFIAGYHLCYKQAMGAEPSAAAVFAVSLGVALPLYVLRLRLTRSLPLRLFSATLPFALYGAVCAASFLIFLMSLKDAGAGFVLTLRNTSVLFATLLGWCLGQPTTRQHVLGSILVAMGAVLLGLNRP
jgi:drug/metabolite transporter (DMT)-like permease